MLQHCIVSSQQSSHHDRENFRSTGTKIFTNADKWGSIHAWDAALLHPQRSPICIGIYLKTCPNRAYCLIVSGTRYRVVQLGTKVVKLQILHGKWSNIDLSNFQYVKDFSRFRGLSFSTIIHVSCALECPGGFGFYSSFLIVHEILIRTRTPKFGWNHQNWTLHTEVMWQRKLNDTCYVSSHSDRSVSSIDQES